MQIEAGAPILIELNKKTTDPIEIAEMELEAKVLPIILRRRVPGSDEYQDIPIEWLLN